MRTALQWRSRIFIEYVQINYLNILTPLEKLDVPFVDVICGGPAMIGYFIRKGGRSLPLLHVSRHVGGNPQDNERPLHEIGTTCF